MIAYDDVTLLKDKSSKECVNQMLMSTKCQMEDNQTKDKQKAQFE